MPVSERHVIRWQSGPTNQNISREPDITGGTRATTPLASEQLECGAGGILLDLAPRPPGRPAYCRQLVAAVRQ